MKYYAEVLDNVIINLGTYDNDLPEGLLEITKEQFETIQCGITLLTEL